MVGNEFRGCPAHSAEYFGDTRDHWWNADYLAFIAQRWRLETVHDVLDVGCGIGHWGRLLGSVLPRATRVVGIDREPLWVEKATERALAAGLSPRYRYQQGDVNELPFPDAAFDMVTCQTLLMHVPDAARVLVEMVRVVRPGGIVVVSEPNNVLGPMLADAVGVADALAEDDGPTRVASCLRFQLICQRGRRRLGEGDDFVGERLPALFASVGLIDVHIRLNDKTSPLVPPYDQPEQRATIEEVTNFIERGRWIWPRETTLRYFLAGGGAEAEFAELWDGILDLSRKAVAALRDQSGSCSGGNLGYLAWGWKP